MKNNLSEKYSIVDFETTGFSPENGDRCIEIAIALVQDGIIIDRYQSLTRSGVAVSNRITALTGITSADLESAPPSEQVINDVLKFSQGTTLVAHNAAFDQRFWRSEVLQATGEPDQRDFVCTLKLARRLIPGRESYKLNVLGVPFGYQENEGHRAMHDVNVTANLFFDLVDKARNQFPEEQVGLDFLRKIQSAPISKVSKGLVGKKKAGKPDVPKIPSSPIPRDQVSTARAESISDLQAADILGRIDDENIVVAQLETRRYKNGNVSSYKVTIAHEILNRNRLVSARSLEILHSKLQKQVSQWDKKYREVERLDTHDSNRSEVQHREESVSFKELKSILAHTLGVDDAVDWNDLRVTVPFSFEREHEELIRYGENEEPLEPVFKTIDENKPVPPKLPREPDRRDYTTTPSLWQSLTLQSNRLLEDAERRYAEAYRRWGGNNDAALHGYEVELENWKKGNDRVEKDNSYIKVIFEHQRQTWKNAYEKYETEVKLLNSDVDGLEVRYLEKDTDAVEEYCLLVLERSVYPELWQREVMVDYQADQKTLIVNFKLPEFDELPKVKVDSGKKSNPASTLQYYSTPERISIYESVVTQIIVRTIHELFEADVVDAIDDVCVNGYITQQDNSEKHISNKYVASVYSEKSSFNSTDLSLADPVALYYSLGGRGKFDEEAVWTIDPIVGSERGKRKRQIVADDEYEIEHRLETPEPEPEIASPVKEPLPSDSQSVLPHPDTLLDQVSIRPDIDKLILQLRNNAGSAGIPIGCRLSDILDLTEDKLGEIPNIGSTKILKWRELVEMYQGRSASEEGSKSAALQAPVTPSVAEVRGFKTTKTIFDESFKDKLDLSELRLIQAQLTSAESSALKRYGSRGFATDIQHLLGLTGIGLRKINGIGEKVSKALTGIREKCEIECAKIASGEISLVRRESFLVGFNYPRPIHLKDIDKTLTEDVIRFRDREDVDQEVLQHRWGFGKRKSTLEEIGDSRDQTRERIRQIELELNERLKSSLRILDTEVYEAVSEVKKSELSSLMPVLFDNFDTEQSFIKFIQYVCGDDNESTAADESAIAIENTIYPKQLQELLHVQAPVPLVGEEVLNGNEVVAMLEWQWSDHKVGFADNLNEAEAKKLLGLGWRLVYDHGDKDIRQLKQWLLDEVSGAVEAAELELQID